MTIGARVLDFWFVKCFEPKKSFPKLVFRPHIPRLRYFLKFDDFIRFKL